MRSISTLWCSPSSLILSLILPGAVTIHAAELPWPYNLPPHVKYYPQDESLIKRDISIAQRVQIERPQYVRKMSGDPGEKFFLDYWSFDADGFERPNESSNSTTFVNFNNPLSLHANVAAAVPDTHLLRRLIHFAVGDHDLFQKRAFECPADTQACASINRPNTCCPSGSTCQIVPDTGLGDVGCCDASQTCAGSLSQCPTDYVSCPNNPGGGCCLPGYACYQEGCVLTSTVIVTVVPTPTTTSSRTTSTEPVTTTVIVTPSTTTTSTTTSTDEQTTPTSTTSATLACSSGFRSCPASLGGGCCPTDRACGRDVCPEITSSGSLSPPVRPTTDTRSITTTASTTSRPSVSGCPTGFYACSAYHQGGCCQVDRDCQKTSCPAASETAVNTNGVTVVVPTGGSCASGWATCDANVGGGCCPSGYSCGTAVCSATASGQANEVGKGVANKSERLRTTLDGNALCVIMIMMAMIV